MSGQGQGILTGGERSVSPSACPCPRACASVRSAAVLCLVAPRVGGRPCTAGPVHLRAGPGAHLRLPPAGTPEGEPECRPLLGTPGATAGGPAPSAESPARRVSRQPPGPRWAPGQHLPPACACSAFVWTVAPGNSARPSWFPPAIVWPSPRSAPGAACCLLGYSSHAGAKFALWTVPSSKRLTRSCRHPRAVDASGGWETRATAPAAQSSGTSSPSAGPGRPGPGWLSPPRVHSHRSQCPRGGPAAPSSPSSR